MVLSKQILYVGALAVLALAAGLLMQSGDDNLQGLVLVALFLMIVMVFVVAPWVTAEDGKFFRNLIIVAFFLKWGASGFRAIWGLVVKDGHIDAGRYDRAGTAIAEGIRRLDFSYALSYLSYQGTRFVEGITGVIYSITGPTMYGGFLIFSTFALLGSCLFYRAYRIAFPEGNKYIFFGLIFFYPSWLYWPSSIGKDALMALSIGVVAYGAAKFLRQGSITGILLVAAGVTGSFWVRPHISAMLLAALAICVIFRQYRLGPLGPLVKVAMLAIVVSVGWVVLSIAAGYVRMDEVSLDAALDQYEEFQDTASRGGAAFTPTPITHPLGVPSAIVTVLYRPFPWEAHRLAALALALESSVLLVLTILRFGSLKAAIGSARSDPFLIFIFVYMLLCIMAFTTFGNFSIVGRQRLQFLPLFFMLLAYPTVAERKKAESVNDEQSPVGGASRAAPQLARRTL